MQLYLTQADTAVKRETDSERESTGERGGNCSSFLYTAETGMFVFIYLLFHCYEIEATFIIPKMLVLVIVFVVVAI